MTTYTKNHKKYKRSEAGKVSAKRYAKKHTERIKLYKRNYRLLKTYGITLEDYDVLYEKQNGVCAICGLPEITLRLQVDHCHATGKIRGLLCLYCNNVIGKANDDTVILKKAIKYLEASRQR